MLCPHLGPQDDERAAEVSRCAEGDRGLGAVLGRVPIRRPHGGGLSSRSGSFASASAPRPAALALDEMRELLPERASTRRVRSALSVPAIEMVTSWSMRAYARPSAKSRNPPPFVADSALATTRPVANTDRSRRAVMSTSPIVVVAVLSMVRRASARPTLMPPYEVFEATAWPSAIETDSMRMSWARSSVAPLGRLTWTVGELVAFERAVLTLTAPPPEPVEAAETRSSPGGLPRDPDAPPTPSSRSGAPARSR